MALSVQPNPEFSADLSIPVVGGDPLALTVRYRHLGKRALAEFLERAKTANDLDSVAEVIVGWSLPDAFSREALDEFLDGYHHAAVVMLEGYVTAIAEARRKN